MSQRLLWSREQLGSNVFRAAIPVKKSKDWEAWVLLSSDRHWDNPKSDWELQKKHLDEAVSKGAVILDCGDLFCVMQGKFDKRSSKASVRPEHQVDNYLDKVVSDAAEWFKPYRDNLLVVGHGNHETAIKNRLEIDLTERFVTLLNAGNTSAVYNGHFSGWVQFVFTDGEYTDNKRIRFKTKTVLHYDHGYGGGAQLTSDMIQHSRRSMYLPDADIVISGHTHDAWSRDMARVRLSDRGIVYHDIQTHIKLPTYKEEYGEGTNGWQVERGGLPKPIGAYWLRFSWSSKFQRVIHEAIRAY